jgi:hypothetical protein
MSQTITGCVVSDNGQPVVFANVVALNSSDSSFIQGVICDDKGMFKIQVSDSRDYLVKVSSIGYDTQFIHAKTGDIGKVLMKESRHMLDEVVIKGHQPQFKMTNEGLQTNVAGTVLSKMGNAEDILTNVPGLQKKGGSYEVFGKGTPQFYINGRKITDMEELKRLNSSDIKYVELITSPGAKYDASVRAVVLIKTQRKQGDGFSLNVSSTYYQGMERTLADGLNVNYRHHGMDVFGNVYYSDAKSKSNNEVIQKIYTDTTWIHKSMNPYRLHTGTVMFSGGMNYILNDSNSLGFRYNTSVSTVYHGHGTFSTGITANNLPYDEMETKETESMSYRMPHDLNVYYNGKIGGTTVDFNADYLYNRSNKESENDETSQLNPQRVVTSTNNVRNQLLAFKLNLGWNVLGGNLSAGVEYTHTDRRDGYQNVENIVPTSVNQLKENHLSPFMEYVHSLWGGTIRTGLRYEMVKADYYAQDVYMDGQSKKYNNLFPSISYMKEIGKVSLSLNYLEKINRPSYLELSNGVSYVNKFTWQTGNAFLASTIDHSLSLQLMWKIMNMSVEYEDQHHAIINWGDQLPDQKSTMLLTYKNIDHSRYLKSMVTVAPKFNIWEPSLTVGFQKNWCHIPTDTGELSPKSPIFFGQMSNNFVFSQSLTGVVNMDLTSKGDQENASYDRITFNTEVSIIKSFFNNRFSVKLSGYDLFKTSNSHLTVNYNHAQFTNNVNIDTRMFAITLRYNFNSVSSKYKGSGAGSDEKSRL